jgi:hypothetical protein
VRRARGQTCLCSGFRVTDRRRRFEILSIQVGTMARRFRSIIWIFSFMQFRYQPRQPGVMA